MPSPNIVKQFVEGGVYHVSHRGTADTVVFADEADYDFFIGLLKYYLVPDEESGHRRSQLKGNVELLGYCLLPDHIHLIVRQHSITAMTQLMRAIGNAYIRYYNAKYNRSGALFVGKYRAALVETDEQLLHLTRYLHRHPKGWPRELADYPFSSYAYYLRQVVPLWINPAPAWERFYNLSDYQAFVEGGDLNSGELLGRLTLDPIPA